MKMSLVRRMAQTAAVVLIFALPAVYAENKSYMDDAKVGSGSTLSYKEFRTDLIPKNAKGVDASADVYEYVGDNLIARGHAVIKYGDITITADKFILNLESRDLEAAGHVTFAKKQKTEKIVDYEEYQDLLDDDSLSVKFIEYVKVPTGMRKIKVSVENVPAYMKADRVSGNLTSGLFQFRNFAFQNGPLFFAAAEAERSAGGQLTIRDAKITTCDYIVDDHDHYSISAGKAVITPREYNSGIQNYNPSHREHSVLAYNTLLRLWDLPVFWLPVLYKPTESDNFGIDVDFGQSSDYGFYVRASKGFSILDTPLMQLNVAPMVNYYSKRGLAYGAKLNFVTDNSRTEMFGIFMHDRKPYESFDYNYTQRHYAKKHARLKIPNQRYDFKITNLTHITPSLDFRGQFELLSDYQFLELSLIHI